MAFDTVKPRKNGGKEKVKRFLMLEVDLCYWLLLRGSTVFGTLARVCGMIGKEEIFMIKWELMNFFESFLDQNRGIVDCILTW